MKEGEDAVIALTRTGSALRSAYRERLDAQGLEGESGEEASCAVADTRGAQHDSWAYRHRLTRSTPPMTGKTDTSCALQRHCAPAHRPHHPPTASHKANP